MNIQELNETIREARAILESDYACKLDGRKSIIDEETLESAKKLLKETIAIVNAKIYLS